MRNNKRSLSLSENKEQEYLSSADDNFSNISEEEDDDYFEEDFDMDDEDHNSNDDELTLKELEEHGEDQQNKKSHGSGYFANLSLEEKKKLKLERKEVTQERKKAKSGGSLIQKAKFLWPELRLKSLDSKRRSELMSEMMKLITGNIEEMILKHDASRIIQCCLKYGNLEQRNIIASELTSHFVELSKSQYGKFIVSKILNFCPKYRHQVISSFYGKVHKLIRHTHASIVIEEAYSQFANSSQRLSLIEEFYGPEYTLFKGEAKSLNDILMKNPEKRDNIMKHLREVITGLLEKGNVTIGLHTIIHRILWEYISHLSSSDNDNNQRQELIELIKEHLVTILHTREGARVAQYCIMHASPKDRKLILRTFKTFVKKIALEQYGHAVLLSCFECVDDTVLVGKTIIGELISSVKPSDVNSLGVANFSELLMSKYASRVILFLLCGRNRKYQPAYIVNELNEADQVKQITTKKAWGLKQKELVTCIEKSLCESFEQDLCKLIRDKSAGQVFVEFMKQVQKSSQTKNKIYESIGKEMNKTMEEATAFNTIKSSEEPFHAVKKLKADADLEKAMKQEGIDQHIMLNKNSQMVLKELINPDRIKKQHQDAAGVKEIQEDVNTISYAYSNLELVQCMNTHLDMQFWVNHCLETAKENKPSQVSYILVALLEASKGNDTYSVLRSTIQQSIGSTMNSETIGSGMKLLFNIVSVED